MVEKYGSGRGDQIVFLVPSTQQSPVVVDCIDGMWNNVGDLINVAHKVLIFLLDTPLS